MDVSMKQTNNILAALICCVAAYALFIIIKDIGSVYQGWSAFFDQRGSIYPATITLIIALVPISLGAIAYLIYLNRRTYYILFPIAHVLLLFPSYVSYGMVVLTLIWWFSKNAAKST
jgi:hypothetical protein